MSAFFYFVFSAMLAGQSLADHSRNWEPQKGNVRVCIVDLTSDARESSKAKGNFRFNIIAAGSEAVSGRDCWKLIFFPNDDFPPEAQHRIIVHVDKQHGWPRKATPVKSDAVVKIQQVDAASFILDAPAGVPLDVLPLIPSQEFRDGPATLKFQSTRAGKD